MLKRKCGVHQLLPKIFSWFSCPKILFILHVLRSLLVGLIVSLCSFPSSAWFFDLKSNDLHADKFYAVHFSLLTGYRSEKKAGVY